MCFHLFNLLCAAFSGLLQALAIPNEILTLGSPFLGFVSLAPLYMAAKNARTYRGMAALFAVDALVTHLLSSYWLSNFKDFAIFTLGASAVGTACIEAMAGCIFFALTRRSGLSAYLTPLFFAGTRVVYEWAKSTGFLAYPWGVLSMSAFRNKTLLQSADIFGIYGIAFLMALFSATLGEAVLFFTTKKTLPPFAEQKAFFNLKCQIKSLLLLTVCFCLYGSARLVQKFSINKTLNAVLVQQNKDPWESSDDTESTKTSMELSQEGLDRFKENGLSADLVVWSEAVLRYAFPLSYVHYTAMPEEESLIHFIKRSGVPFIIGGSYAIDSDEKKYANAALLFDKNANFRGYYGKSHLVPFAEVIPGVEYEWVKKAMDKIVGFSNGWTSGGTYTLFDVKARYANEKEKPPVRIIDLEKGSIDPYTYEGLAGTSATVRVAVPICFEDAFPDVCGPFHQAGAEVFVNITDDSWSLTKSAEYQHFVVASFRAVEYRTTLVRSTNAGFTAVVDPKGNVLQSLPLFERGSLSAEIPVYQRMETVYSRYGNWFVHCILIALAALLFIQALKYKRPSLKECIRAELERIDVC